MFGYIRPLEEELKIRDYNAYRAAYCGLCRTLGRRYGLAARFFVNYDMTFLYFLLSCGSKSGELTKCACPANVFCKKTCYTSDSVFDFVADTDVILCYYKLRDNISDAGFFRSVPYRMAAAMTARAYKKAAKRQPELNASVKEQLDRLSGLETEKSGSIDATADTFASILKCCAAYYPQQELRRPLEQVLYHVGRFLYLADALDDLGRDIRQEAYNPLRYRFHTVDGALTQEDKEYLLNLLDGSVNLAGAAYELLPKGFGQGVLENILYYGMPRVWKLVSQGTFQEKRKININRQH